MNRFIRIFAAITLVLSLCLFASSCKKDENKNDDSISDSTQSGGDQGGDQGGDKTPDVDIDEDDSDGTIDVEINLGDITNKDDGIDPDDGKITYEEYWSWTAEEREEYFNSFESADAFFAWYNQMNEEYNNKQDAPVIDENGEINLGGK